MRQLNVRVSDEVHAAAQARAEQEHLSVQDYIQKLIAADTADAARQRADIQQWAQGFLADNAELVEALDAQEHPRAAGTA
jgi:predicted HicB family RNase H-like nuclease